jgi:hypothetical protein
MLSGWGRIAALACVAVALAGCASDRTVYGDLPANTGAVIAHETPPPELPSKPLQCAPYAREHSAVKLYGDAWTWWEKAAGKFSREFTPQTGAVLVLAGYAGPERGHVAVVRSQISTREIRVDHANWLGDGAIYLDDPVTDVSQNNDWSRVRVWNIRTGGWGTRIYPVQGFIGPGAGSAPNPPETPDEDADPARIARAELGIIQ